MGLNFLPRTSFEVNKDHKNVFYIEDPDADGQEDTDLVGPVVIHRISSGESDEKERPNPECINKASDNPYIS